MLVLDVDFRQGGNSSAYVLHGWAEPETTHRWTFGQEAALRLPAACAGGILVINATPCRHPPGLVAQVVMLAIGDRLLGSAQWDGLLATSFRLPSCAPGQDLVLRFLHLSCQAPRGPGQVRRGAPLGLMVHSLRVFLPEAGRAVPELASSPQAARPLAERFESIGQGCQFGLVQRQCGAEPHGLLRFVDTTTAMLYEGLCRGFGGIEDVVGLALHGTDKRPPTYRWTQQTYGLCLDTWVPVGSVDEAVLLRGQSRRLVFLRRKFFEDVALADKIFVLTRGDCLTEQEALAVFCALTLHGPATLLWTVFGDAARAGEVDRLAPGFLRGQLGLVDDDRYASQAAWLAVMRAAWSLTAPAPPA